MPLAWMCGSLSESSYKRIVQFEKVEVDVPREKYIQTFCNNNVKYDYCRKEAFSLLIFEVGQKINRAPLCYRYDAP